LKKVRSLPDDPGVCTSYDSLCFWAVGSGQQQALSSIFFSFQDVGFNPQFEQLLYDLCAAKFMSETAEGVGQATNLLVHRFGSPPSFMADSDIDKLRKIWEHEGRPRIPERIIERVKQLPLHPMEDIL
jgi:hypothetical protein